MKISDHARRAAEDVHKMLGNEHPSTKHLIQSAIDAAREQDARRIAELEAEIARLKLKKAHVVMYHDYENTRVDGIFSSRELAEKYVKEMYNTCHIGDIDEYELDQEILPYWEARIYLLGGKIEVRELKMLGPIDGLPKERDPKEYFRKDGSPAVYSVTFYSTESAQDAIDRAEKFRKEWLVLQKQYEKENQ